MRYAKGSIPDGWLVHLPAAKRARMSRHALTMAALRGEIRTMPFGPMVLFHAGDVDRIGHRAA